MTKQNPGHIDDATLPEVAGMKTPNAVRPSLTYGCCARRINASSCGPHLLQSNCRLVYHWAMPNYRRAIIPGGSFFFTLVVHKRRPLFSQSSSVALLGSVFRRCQMRWPFTMNAIVLLPNHLHAIWSLPPGDDEYSKRWGWLKKEFTKQWLQIGGTEWAVSEGRKRERRRGVWQPRFWEHTLEDEEDFERHFDYIHWNPVKHGYVQRPYEWSHSSFHRYVRLGVYDRRWGCFTEDHPGFDFRDIENTARE